MGSKSDWLEDQILDHVLGTTPMSSPADIYVGLFNVEPTDAFDPTNNGVNGTEVSGGNYAREIITFDAANGGTTQNASAVTFNTATDNWEDGVNVQIVAFGVFDALTEGHLLYWGAISPFKQVLIGDTASFADGALVITES